ncbi:hypothetical protein COO60DRAFT_1520111 [Scenedesmus sp. NREL 46B-D3]|nr:hypothetical protein COO60DRAFT_1520111 [Scenedesmus sp. NREL 46B-D3]
MMMHQGQAETVVVCAALTASALVFFLVTWGGWTSSGSDDEVRMVNTWSNGDMKIIASLQCCCFYYRVRASSGSVWGLTRSAKSGNLWRVLVHTGFLVVQVGAVKCLTANH